MSSEIITALISAGSALILSVLGFVVSRLKQRTTDARLSQIEKSDLVGIYVKCPNCGEKVYLEGITFYKEVNPK